MFAFAFVPICLVLGHSLHELITCLGCRHVLSLVDRMQVFLPLSLLFGRYLFDQVFDVLWVGVVAQNRDKQHSRVVCIVNFIHRIACVLAKALYPGQRPRRRK